jgi:hypothetical protein
MNSSNQHSKVETIILTIFNPDSAASLPTAANPDGGNCPLTSVTRTVEKLSNCPVTQCDGSGHN